jgi:uncharacterized protein with PIN domain
MKMSDENVIYCLENLAGYEPDDIDCDDVEIAVNDDQFATMSIVRTAELGAELARRLTEENAKLREALEQSSEVLRRQLSQYYYKDEVSMLNQYESNKQLLNQLKGQDNDK